MDKIVLKGLYFEACHGVLDFEKGEKQPFIIDVEMDMDLTKAGSSDNLAESVDYSKVYELVKFKVLEKTYDLIEKLAYEILTEVLRFDERIQSVRVSVHKPKAPIEAKFDDVVVVMERTRDVLLLS